MSLYKIENYTLKEKKIQLNKIFLKETCLKSKNTKKLCDKEIITSDSLHLRFSL